MKEFILSTDILTEFEIQNTNNYKVRAVILMPEGEKFYLKDLMGKTSIEWVEDALKDYEIKKIDITKKDSLVEVVKDYVADEDYLIVLYADTPLVNGSVVNDALDYAITKKVDYCKLYRGAIIKVSALKSGNFETISQAEFLGKENFYTIFDFASLLSAREKLRKLIIENHLKNKVEFYNASSCYIDCDVIIKSGVKIYSNNTLKGNCEIRENTILMENNIIEDSQIGANCVLINSYVKSKKIKDNTKLSPFTILNGEKK